MTKEYRVFKPKDCNSFKKVILSEEEKMLLKHYLNPANYYILFEDIAEMDSKDSTKNNYDVQNKKDTRSKTMEHNIKLMYGVSNAHSIIQDSGDIYFNSAHIYCLLEFLSILASDILTKVINAKERILMNKQEYNSEPNKDIELLPVREKDLNSLKYLDSKIRYVLDYGSLKIIEKYYKDFSLKVASDFVSKRYKR